ncbi:MAG: THUMP domain-containing protein [Methylocystis silviterrae]
MKNWNVIVSIYQDGFKRALRALREFGSVGYTSYHNILVMVAGEDPLVLLDSIELRAKERPALYDAISRVAPAMRNFEFQSAEEFLEKAKSIILEWSPQLAGQSFHVRFHRRGSTHDLRTPDVERFLDDALLEALRGAGAPGAVSFSDPDAVIAIDTIDDRVGVGLWRRDDLERHPLLRPD